MSYKPLGGYRKFLAASALAACLGGVLGEPPRSYADELVENNKILTLVGKVGNLLMKAKGNSFDYELTDADVNGDGTPDKIKLKLKEGFIPVDTSGATKDGQRLDMEFDIGDSFGSERKIYAIVDKDGKVSICKSRNLGTGGNDVEPYLDALIKRLEK
jgi:hypothetical protein